VSKYSRKKLEPTTEKGIFVGYSETTQAYKVYLPRLKKTILRRDVRFEQSRALLGSLEREQVVVPKMEELLAPNEEPHSGDKRPAQQHPQQGAKQDDEEKKLGREQTVLRDS